jgi:predicted transcriptional regulator
MPWVGALRTKQVTFRLDDETLAALDYLAPWLELSKTAVVRESVRAVLHFIQVAVAHEVADIKELIERYGEDARITISISKGSEEGALPEGHVLIDGVEPDDVVALGIEEGAKRVHMFLSLTGWQTEHVGAAQLGNAVLLTRPMLPLGHLPWPPDPMAALSARLGDLVPSGRLANAPDDALQELRG